MIWAWMETSRAETGSSQMMSDGSTLRARAIPTRWRWPPLNSWGYRSMARADMPTRASSSSVRAAAAVRPRTPVMRKPSPMASPTLMRGLSEP